MTPTAAAFLAVTAGGALAALAGVAVGRWLGRRDRAAHRAYTAVLETDLARVERERDHLAAEAATFPERLQQAWDAGRAATQQVGTVRDIFDPGHGEDWPIPAHGVRVPPERWATLREAQENWETN